MQLIKSIQNRIYEVRDQRVMLDRDLAALYETETKIFNLAVRANMRRFPPDFMFQLTAQEYESLGLQIETSNTNLTNVVRKVVGRSDMPHLPFAFTATGVAMLSVVLNSATAINMHVSIIRALVSVRKKMLAQADWKVLAKQIKNNLGENSTKVLHICAAIENLLDDKAAQRKWDDRERIGFQGRMKATYFPLEDLYGYTHPITFNEINNGISLIKADQDVSALEKNLHSTEAMMAAAASLGEDG